jgi:DNA repair exonuclease SbcCD ATPase subunit
MSDLTVPTTSPQQSWIPAYWLSYPSSWGPYSLLGGRVTVTWHELAMGAATAIAAAGCAHAILAGSLFYAIAYGMLTVASAGATFFIRRNPVVETLSKAVVKHEENNLKQEANNKRHEENNQRLMLENAKLEATNKKLEANVAQHEANNRAQSASIQRLETTQASLQQENVTFQESNQTLTGQIAELRRLKASYERLLVTTRTAFRQHVGIADAAVRDIARGGTEVIDSVKAQIQLFATQHRQLKQQLALAQATIARFARHEGNAQAFATTLMQLQQSEQTALSRLETTSQQLEAQTRELAQTRALLTRAMQQHVAMGEIVLRGLREWEARVESGQVSITASELQTLSSQVQSAWTRPHARQPITVTG